MKCCQKAFSHYRVAGVINGNPMLVPVYEPCQNEAEFTHEFLDGKGLCGICRNEFDMNHWPIPGGWQCIDADKEPIPGGWRRKECSEPIIVENQSAANNP